MMINAHDKMVKNEVREEVAQKAIPIPSPEEAATAEMVPDANPNATAMNTSPATEPMNPNDPLGYNKLPDLNTLDVAVGSPFKGNLDANTAANPSKGVLPDNAPVDNTPALSPSDIHD